MGRRIMGRQRTQKSSDYTAIERVDGRHPFREAVGDGYVDYEARRVRGCRLIYFNFDLARDMGLISPDHPDRLNAALRRAVVDTFGLVILNEFDRAQDRPVPTRDRLPNAYMATRYLQLQHPGRSGKTSGDGRSVWNGTHRSKGVTWDLSSCGTGVTRLCPATAEQGVFFKTANGNASYGCGTASLDEGLGAALMSETFHRSGLVTERVLAVLERPDGFAINVRAARNLLRPSHFMVHLKQGRLDALRGAVHLFVGRQQANGLFPRLKSNAAVYRQLAEETARAFGKLAATLEREYIFCWLDWDGDNILADGGIIDYGSVRQFGLCHREYRFDDGPRWSTTLHEQRRKARLIVQNFAQMRDYLLTGRKAPLRSYRRDRILRLFDTTFAQTRRRLLLRQIGIDDAAQHYLLRQHLETVDAFDRAHAYFERARSARGPRRVEDGLNWNAIFSTRDLLRELPQRYLEEGSALGAKEFYSIAASNYATRADLRMTPYRRRMASRFQRKYLELVDAVAARQDMSTPRLLVDIAGRSGSINRHDRITGDAVYHAARKLIRHRRQLSAAAFHDVIRRFVRHQTPELSGDVSAPRRADARRVFDYLNDLVLECRHGL